MPGYIRDDERIPTVIERNTIIIVAANFGGGNVDAGNIITIYLRQFFRQQFLLHLAGNLSWVEGKPFLHAHVVLGGPDFQALGGHLFGGTVSVTAELFFRPNDERVDRQWNEDVGLNLMDL